MSGEDGSTQNWGAEALPDVKHWIVYLCMGCGTYAWAHDSLVPTHCTCSGALVGIGRVARSGDRLDPMPTMPQSPGAQQDRLADWHQSFSGEVEGELTPYGQQVFTEMIAAHQQAEQERHRQDEMLSALVELADAAIWTADRSGQGSDRVWEIAKRIKALREAR